MYHVRMYPCAGPLTMARRLRMPTRGWGAGRLGASCVLGDVQKERAGDVATAARMTLRLPDDWFALPLGFSEPPLHEHQIPTNSHHIRPLSSTRQQNSIRAPQSLCRSKRKTTSSMGLEPTTFGVSADRKPTRYHCANRPALTYALCKDAIYAIDSVSDVIGQCCLW